MSDMYAIKASTLSAIGDAIRDKQGQYIYTDEPNIPGYTIVFDSTKIEPTIINNIVYWKVNVSREEMFSKYYNELTYIKAMFTTEGNINGELQFSLECKLDNSNSYISYFTKTNFSDIATKSPKGSFNQNIQEYEFRLYCTGQTYQQVHEPFKISLFLYFMNKDDKYFIENNYTPLEMAEAINEMMILPSSALNITGNCTYRFSNDGWNWFIQDYEDKITTKDITNATYMFYQSFNLTKIPFDINLAKSARSIEYMFRNCTELEYIPNVQWQEMPTTITIIKNIFTLCIKLKEIPEWFINVAEQNFNIALSTGAWNDFGPFGQLFDSCYSIRKIPGRLMKVLWNPVATSNYYTVIYSNPFNNMNALDELINIQFEDIKLDSNQFTSWFQGLTHVNRITVATNEDGSPLIRQWKSQTLDLSRNLGYGWVSSQDFTTDKLVKDDATYQALKNDPDWFSTDINYSRYNRISAVETINSLPDTSAYLATAGGTNTIKFKGASGNLTDGGAINTMTEEEIAVATAKGWTVVFA